MAFLGGLELFVGKGLIYLLGKIGVTGKVAAALSAGGAVIITAVAIRKAIQWANKEYKVNISEEHFAAGLKALECVMTGEDACEVLDRVNEEVTIQGAARIIARHASEFFGTQVESHYGEALIASAIHAIGDEKKLGLAV
jgi:hypothetical protein